MSPTRLTDDCGQFAVAEAVMFRSGAGSNEYKSAAPTQTVETNANYASTENSRVHTSFSPETEATSRAVAESATIAREIREVVLSAFVASSSTITGQIEFKSLLRIDGVLSGRITSAEGTLVVASGGRVHANVTVAVARIHGTVAGDLICSERIELGPTANVTGNIYAPKMSIEAGAVLDGNCKMTTPAPEAQVVPEPVAGEIVVAEETVIAEEVAVVQRGTTSPEAGVQQDAVTQKSPKIGRKGNVLGTKPKRTRTKVAARKASTAEPADDERAATAVAG
jgi:cytoskeletal protein CcmA (bactofilin family)